MRHVVVLFVLLAAGRTSADERLTKARAHHRAGEAAFQAGAYDRAIAEFSAAYELAPRPVLLYNLAAAYRRRAEVQHELADLRQALEDYRRYLDEDPDGRGAAEAHAYVASLTRELEARTPPPDAPPPAPVPLPPPAPAPAPPPAPPPASAEGARGRSLRVAGMASAGVGVALVGTGLYFAVRARELDREVGALTEQWDQGLYDRAHAAQRNAVIGLAAGGAAIAAGAVMVFVLGRPAPVAIHPSGRGLAVSGRF